MLRPKHTQASTEGHKEQFVLPENEFALRKRCF
jgi:hypothetical protein